MRNDRMRMKKGFCAVLALILTVLLFAGCQAGETVFDPTDTAVPSETLTERFYSAVSEWETFDDHPAPKNAKWHLVQDEPYSYGFAYGPAADGGIRISFFLPLTPDLGAPESYSVTVPEQIDGIPVTEIASETFFKCASLSRLILPEGLRKIEPSAVYRCSVTELSLPDSLCEIGDGAFLYNWDLTAIKVSERNPFFSARDGVLYSKDGSVLICYPEGRSDAEFTIPDTVTKIAANAFGLRTDPGLKTLTVPASVTQMPEDLFWASYAVEDISLTLRVFPDSVAHTYAKNAGLPYELFGD